MHTTVKYPYPIKHLAIHDKIELAYMDIGKGDQTLLFIHGLANYAPVWKYQLEELSKHYRCIAIDLPGNGYSTRGEYPYSTFFYAESVHQFVTALNLKNPVLVGHSMGGQISMMLALRYPSVYQKLILIASAGIENFTATDKLIMQNLMAIGEYFYSDEIHLENAIRDSFEVPGLDCNQVVAELKSILKKYSAKQWKDMSLASIQGMINEPIHTFLNQIQAQVLLLYGTNDRFIPNKMLHPMETPKSIGTLGATLIPNAQLKMIEKAGHFVHMEKYAEVNTAIINWLA